MFIHHLFPFADRIPQSAQIIYLFGDNQFEVSLGWWGKYCVTLFLFISGYGYSFAKDKPMKYYTKLLSIYRVVVLIFAIYIPLDIYFNVGRVVSDLNAKSILLNLLGVHSNYNGEWWFLFPYVLLVLVTPLLQSLRNKVISLLALSVIAHNIAANGVVADFLFWQTSYVIGFAFGVYSDKLAQFRPALPAAIFLSILCYFIMNYGIKFLWLESMVFSCAFHDLRT